VADFDITTLILSEHEAFRRAFTQIEQLTDPEELRSRWRSLATSWRSTPRARRRCSTPSCCATSTTARARPSTRSRTTTRSARRRRRSTRTRSAPTPWWEAFRAAREATVDHLAEEETDVLPPFQAQVSAEHADELGMRWLQFLEEHADAKGLSGETVDPEATWRSTPELGATGHSFPNGCGSR
jgi:hypothetical protein